MLKLVCMVVTFLSTVSFSNAVFAKDCDFVQASVSNIKGVAAEFGVKSVTLESKDRRNNTEVVGFSFVDSKGDTYLGVNHVNRETCQTEYYNIQKGVTVRFD